MGACELHTPMVTHSPRQLEEQVGQLEIKGVSRKRGCVVRVFNLMRQAKPMHTIIINTPLHRFHTHTRHMEANKKPYCDSTGLKMIW